MRLSTNHAGAPYVLGWLITLVDFFAQFFLSFSLSFRTVSVIDNMLSMMEKYTNNLETIVNERTRQLQSEKTKTDELLYKMLPR